MDYFSITPFDDNWPLLLGGHGPISLTGFRSYQIPWRKKGGHVSLWELPLFWPFIIIGWLFMTVPLICPPSLWQDTHQCQPLMWIPRGGLNPTQPSPWGIWQLAKETISFSSPQVVVYTSAVRHFTTRQGGFKYITLIQNRTLHWYFGVFSNLFSIGMSLK